MAVHFTDSQVLITIGDKDVYNNYLVFTILFRVFVCLDFILKITFKITFSNMLVKFLLTLSVTWATIAKWWEHKCASTQVAPNIHEYCTVPMYRCHRQLEQVETKLCVMCVFSLLQWRRIFTTTNIIVSELICVKCVRFSNW